MNKIGRPTYLSNNKEYLIVAAYEIEGGHGLTLDSNYLLGQLQHVIKDFKFYIYDIEIPNNVTLEVFPPSRQARQ